METDFLVQEVETINSANLSEPPLFNNDKSTDPHHPHAIELSNSYLNYFKWCMQLEDFTIDKIPKSKEASGDPINLNAQILKQIARVN